MDFNKMSFAWASPNDSVGTYKILSDNVVNDGKSLGIKMTRYNNAFDGPTAVSNARLIAQSKPDVAIDSNQVAGVQASVGAIFKQANIKCIALAVLIDGCHTFSYDHQALGTSAGDAMAAVAKKRGWTAANTTIVISTIAAAGTESTNSPRYFYLQAAKDLGMKPVAPTDINPSTTSIGGTQGLQVDCKGALDTASSAMRNAMGNIPKGNHIMLFGLSDECAQGAYLALKQGGFANSILVGGGAASPFAVTALRTDPNWVIENALFVQDWGPYMLAEAVAVASGATVPDVTEAPVLTLTKDTESKYYNPDGTPKLLPPLGPNNQYLAKYNILQKFAKIEGLNA